MGIFPKDRDLTQAPEEVELLVDGSFYRIKAEAVSIRLDRFLGDHLRWRSRTSIQALVRNGYVLIDPVSPDHPNGTGVAHVETRPGRKLRHGTRVIVVIPEEARLQISDAGSAAVDVLYEDDEVLAVDKPPHVAVHPSGRHFSDTLIQRVHARYKESIEEGGEAPRLCHRLDRETSGIVLIGKHPSTHGEVMKQFETRSVEKEYLAIVWGEMEDEQGTIDYALAPAHMSEIRLKMTVAVDGAPSRTDWQVVSRYRGYTLVACRLLTGRQHQIRVHLAALGYPVVGDKLYGPDEGCFLRANKSALTPADFARLELDRHALHNYRLVFDSPASGERVEVRSELARDLVDFLDNVEERSGI
ncbi:MAG: RluA family pseudouridine synthase [bacterium]|nr:RluA family pseudouridine synthase [bacterium]